MAMATTLDRPTSAPDATERRTATIPTTIVVTGRPTLTGPGPASITPRSRRWGAIGLLGLRLAIGFEFLWAFFDKTFGLGYATSSTHAWLNGGSPTTGFLSGVNVGPFQGIFNGIAGSGLVDWVFMLGLLGVGLALILGVALRPAAIAGMAMLLLMYTASWPFATLGGGQPTGSTNPLVDDHIVSSMALVVIAAFAAWSVGALSRRWVALPFVRSHPWLR
jgi:thiosulfate dehydrogenase (quinone) large subunit